MTSFTYTPNIIQINSQAWLHEFHGSWCPCTTDQSLEKLCEASAVSFQCSDDDHDDVCIGVELGSMNNTIMDLKKINSTLKTLNFPFQKNLSYLLCSVDFLHGTGDKLNWQKLADFVSNIERCVENDVPADCGDEKLR